MESSRKVFFTEGEYVGDLTTEIGYKKLLYHGYATVSLTLKLNNDGTKFNANITFELTHTDCSQFIEKILFPQKHAEFTAEFATENIQDVSIDEKNMTEATINGTVNIPFIKNIPIFKSHFKEGKITGSTTINKDNEGNIRIKSNTKMFGVFGSVKKKEDIVAAEQLIKSPTLL